MAIERTLFIIKPDGVERHLIGKILAAVEERGFRIAEARLARLTREECQTFYAEHQGKPFFHDLVAYMTSGPVLLAVLERENAVATLSELVGATDPAQANNPGVKKFKSIMSKYFPGGDQGDALNIYGFGVAWTFVYALQHAGKNPTRASLMAALHNLNTGKNPFLYPGIKLQTSAKDNFPIEQENMIKWAGGATGDWQSFGKLLDHIR